MIAPLSCSQEPVLPEVIYSLCLPPNVLLWTNTSTKPLRQVSSNLPLPPLELDYFLFGRRIADFGLALITGALIRSLLETVIPCHSWPLPLKFCKKPPSSLSSICAMPTISYASDKEMNGRPPLTRQLGTMNI